MQRTKAVTKDDTPIELGVILPTVCKRCGGQGHMANECYSFGQKKYDLIPEPEEEEEEQARRYKPPSLWTMLLTTVRHVADSFTIAPLLLAISKASSRH